MGYNQFIQLEFEKQCTSDTGCHAFTELVLQHVKQALGLVLDNEESVIVNSSNTSVSISLDITGRGIYNWDHCLGSDSKTQLNLQEFSRQEKCAISLNYAGDSDEDYDDLKYENGEIVKDMVSVQINKYDTRLEGANIFVKKLRDKGLLEEAVEAESLYRELLGYMALS